MRVVASMIVIGLIESNVVLSVDYIVTGVNVVSFQHHVKYFRLMDSAFLHEVHNLVLNHNSMICVVV